MALSDHDVERLIERLKPHVQDAIVTPLYEALKESQYSADSLGRLIGLLAPAITLPIERHANDGLYRLPAANLFQQNATTAQTLHNLCTNMANDIRAVWTVYPEGLSLTILLQGSYLILKTVLPFDKGGYVA